MTKGNEMSTYLKICVMILRNLDQSIESIEGVVPNPAASSIYRTIMRDRDEILNDINTYRREML